jgi:hypothetical protein
MKRLALALTSLSFVSFATTDVGAQAQCTSALSTNTNFVSVTNGGVQLLQLQTNTPQRIFYVVGSFTAVGTPTPYFAFGGLNLVSDRYLALTYSGRSPFLPGGLPGFLAGHQLLTDVQGTAVQPVVVPPGQFVHLVGRTLRHGVFTLDEAVLPSCGSNTVTLTLVP